MWLWMVDWWPVPLFRPNKISSHARNLQMSTDPNTSWIIIFIVYNDYHSRHHHYYRHHHCCITECLSLHIDLWSGWTQNHNFGPKIVWLLFGCLLVGSSHLLLVLFFFVCSVVGCSVGGLVLKVGLNSREKPWEATLTHFLPRWILVPRSWTHLTCFCSRNCI